jgi:hypothetical protein
MVPRQISVSELEISNWQFFENFLTLFGMNKSEATTVGSHR